MATLLTQDTVSSATFTPRPTWGIFKGGAVVIAADSVGSVDYKQDYRVPDYPMEQGAFQSYNKITTPYDARVQLIKGGSEAERAEFLTQIDNAAASLDLYDVVTPEATYTNANVVHYDYRRTSTNGVTLLTVDIWLLEIRNTAQAAYTSTAAPDGRNPVNGGTVQPQAPTSAQTTQARSVQ